MKKNNNIKKYNRYFRTIGAFVILISFITFSLTAFLIIFLTKMESEKMYIVITPVVTLFFATIGYFLHEIDKTTADIKITRREKITSEDIIITLDAFPDKEILFISDGLFASSLNNNDDFNSIAFMDTKNNPEIKDPITFIHIKNTSGRSNLNINIVYKSINNEESKKNKEISGTKSNFIDICLFPDEEKYIFITNSLTKLHYYTEKKYCRKDVYIV